MQKFTGLNFNMIQKNKYRVEPFKITTSNLWVLQKRIFFFFWKSVGIGSKQEMYEAHCNIEELPE